MKRSLLISAFLVAAVLSFGGQAMADQLNLNDWLAHPVQTCGDKIFTLLSTSNPFPVVTDVTFTLTPAGPNAQIATVTLSWDENGSLPVTLNPLTLDYTIAINESLYPGSYFAGVRIDATDDTPSVAFGNTTVTKLLIEPGITVKSINGGAQSATIPGTLTMLTVHETFAANSSDGGLLASSSNEFLELQPVPAPAALLLGAMGLGLVGWWRKRTA